MTGWYKKKFRRTLMDMHIPDWNREFLKNFDPDRYFEALQRADINAPMIYAQSHTGLCNWPTRSGRMHQGFIGCEDKLQRLFARCREAGMSTILYYSLIYNSEEAYRHPEWRMRSADGADCFQKGARYGVLCPNNMEHRDFVRAQVKEFCEYFDFDGVFFDMTFWPMSCYCDSCRARWEREVGGEMPVIVDWKNPRWVALAEKRAEWMGEFAHFASALVREYRPGATVEHQYNTSLTYWRMGVDERVSMASDYIGTDRYGGVAEQSFTCKVWYHLTMNRPFQYMTSRCYPTLTEHTTTKSIDLLRLSVMHTLAYHGAPLLIDAVDPDGSIDMRAYDLMGECFREAESYEKYMDRGELVYDVALYYDLGGRMNVEQNGLHVEAMENSDLPADAQKCPHLFASMGAAEALRKHHVPFGVVNNWRLELLKQPKVLAVCDDPGMDARGLDAVRAFVKNGGGLYLSGHSAPELLEEIFGVKWKGMTPETYTYMAPVEGCDAMLGEFTPEHPLPMGEAAVRVEGEPRGEVWATLTLPCSIPSRRLIPVLDWYGDSAPFDGRHIRYGSIHSNPPFVRTQAPAMLYAEYGKGRVIWSALPIEKADIPQHERIFVNLMKILMGGEEFLFGAEAEETVEPVLFDAPEHGQKLLSLVNIQENFHTLPVYNSRVWVRTQKKPSGVVQLPGETPVDFTWEDGKVCFTADVLRQVNMYAINE